MGSADQSWKCWGQGGRFQHQKGEPLGHFPLAGDMSSRSRSIRSHRNSPELAGRTPGSAWPQHGHQWIYVSAEKVPASLGHHSPVLTMTLNLQGPSILTYSRPVLVRRVAMVSVDL